MNSTQTLCDQALGDHPLDGHTVSNRTIDGALVLLSAAGFEFELVERCPTACQFCEGAIVEAA